MVKNNSTAMEPKQERLKMASQNVVIQKVRIFKSGSKFHLEKFSPKNVSVTFSINKTRVTVHILIDPVKLSQA